MSHWCKWFSHYLHIQPFWCILTWMFYILYHMLLVKLFACAILFKYWDITSMERRMYSLAYCIRFSQMTCKFSRNLTCRSLANYINTKHIIGDVCARRSSCPGTWISNCIKCYTLGFDYLPTWEISLFLAYTSPFVCTNNISFVNIKLYKITCLYEY